MNAMVIVLRRLPEIKILINLCILHVACTERHLQKRAQRACVSKYLLLNCLTERCSVNAFHLLLHYTSTLFVTFL